MNRKRGKVSRCSFKANPPFPRHPLVLIVVKIVEILRAEPIVVDPRHSIPGMNMNILPDREQAPNDYGDQILPDRVRQEQVHNHSKHGLDVVFRLRDDKVSVDVGDFDCVVGFVEPLIDPGTVLPFVEEVVHRVDSKNGKEKFGEDDGKMRNGEHGDFVACVEDGIVDKAFEWERIEHLREKGGPDLVFKCNVRILLVGVGFPAIEVAVVVGAEKRKREIRDQIRGAALKPPKRPRSTTTYPL